MDLTGKKRIIKRFKPTEQKKTLIELAKIKTGRDVIRENSMLTSNKKA
jgi:hypothetical protein